MTNKSTTQRWIIVFGVALIALMALFPPWTHTFKSKTIYSEKPARYSFIASPPQPRRPFRTDGVKLDIARLGVQMVAVTALTVLALLLFSEQADSLPSSDAGSTPLPKETRTSVRDVYRSERRAFDKVFLTARGKGKQQPWMAPHEELAFEEFGVVFQSRNGNDVPQATRKQIKVNNRGDGKIPGDTRLPDTEIEKLRKHLEVMTRVTGSRARLPG